ncbi:MAG TPA: tetratricopeptide repeat protein [Polyangia bacterium]|nr:tetratricopeptide repeat protein [Polyangia bacterium]
MRWVRWRRSRGRACPAGWELGQAASQGLSAAVAEHIDTCARCASELRALERLRQRARTLPAPAMPAASRARIVMALRTEAIHPRRPPLAMARGFRPWIVATTLGMTIAGGALLTAHHGGRTGDAPPSPVPAAPRRPAALSYPPLVGEGSREAASGQRTETVAPEKPAVAPATTTAAAATTNNSQKPAARHLRLSALARTAAAAATDRAAFEKGWQLFRDGEYMTAAAAFAELERQAAGDAIVEDALFWRSVALARAGEKVQARAAIASFVSRFPRSARAGQACASLGWMLIEAGDRVGARALLERAARDGSETVRTSARRGLQAIEAFDPDAPPPPGDSPSR